MATAEFERIQRQPFFLMVNFTDPHAYRSLDPETKERGPWTFRDRVEGIPKYWSAEQRPSRFKGLTRPSSANALPATITPSSD